MERNQILREILSDPDIIEKYRLRPDEINEFTTNAPYSLSLIHI